MARRNPRRAAFTAFGLALACVTLSPQARLGAAQANRSQAARAPSPQAPPNYRAMLDRQCVTCHNDRVKTAGLALDVLDPNNVAAAPEVWEKVVRKVRVGMMPPQGAPPLDPASRQSLVAHLATALDANAASHPDPGRPQVHRLNRAEYANAVRDLLDLGIDPAALLPADDSAYGFDNVADVLGLSPVLLERYMSAAGKVSALAVGDPDIGVSGETFRVRQDQSQDRQVDGLPVGTVGGMASRVTLPLDGEYVIQPRLFRTNLGAMRGLEYAQQIEILVDGARVHLASFGGDDDFKASLKNPTLAGDDVDNRGRVRLKLAAGPHEIGVAFAYDDFGAGQARLNELSEVPAHFVKFDMGLIRGIDLASERKQKVVGDLVRLVIDLGSVPLAEGVETEAEAEVCRLMGFKLVQGYLTGKPVAVDEPTVAPSGAKARA